MGVGRRAELDRRQVAGLWGRLRCQPADLNRARLWRIGVAASHHALYIGVHPGSRSVNGDVVFASFACRPRVDGDARQRRRRQICGRRRAADARHLLSLDCAVSRFGGRAGHAAKGACRAVRVVQYHRLDHLYYLCCRYRRHRQPRGTDYRNRSLSFAPRISG